MDDGMCFPDIIVRTSNPMSNPKSRNTADKVCNFRNHRARLTAHRIIPNDINPRNHSFPRPLRSAFSFSSLDMPDFIIRSGFPLTKKARRISIAAMTMDVVAIWDEVNVSCLLSRYVLPAAGG